MSAKRESVSMWLHFCRVLSASNQASSSGAGEKRLQGPRPWEKFLSLSFLWKGDRQTRRGSTGLRSGPALLPATRNTKFVPPTPRRQAAAAPDMVPRRAPGAVPSVRRPPPLVHPPGKGRILDPAQLRKRRRTRAALLILLSNAFRCAAGVHTQPLASASHLGVAIQGIRRQ